MPVRGRVSSELLGRPAPVPLGTGLTAVQAAAPLVLSLSGSILVGSVSEMLGATAGADGASGVVPKPTAGQEDFVLHGDATYRPAGSASFLFTTNDRILGRVSAGGGVGEEIVCTAAGRALLDDADAAAQRGTLGLGTAAVANVGSGNGLDADLLDGQHAAAFAAVGHNHAGVYQPLDAELTALAGLASAADRLPYFTGAGTAALATFTGFARNLLDDGDAATALATLGAAASGHTHAGLLSGLTSGYLPRASSATAVVDSPLYTDGTQLALGHATPTDAFHVKRTGSRAGVYLEGLGAGGYGALKVGAVATLSEYLVAAGYVGGVQAAGFSIRDTNAGADRLTIDNTTGRVTLLQGLTVKLGATDALTVRTDGNTVLAAWDKGGAWHDIRAYGASAAAAAATNTTAINAAITAAAATTPRGKVFVPWGTFKTTGGFALDGLDGLGFEGLGPGVSVLDLEHATNDLFTTASTITSNLSFRNFTVTSSVARTAGWAFRVNNAYNGTGALVRSTFSNLEITKQYNGLGLQKYAFLTLNDILIYDPASTSGVGLQFGQTTASNVNQGSDARCRNVHVYGAMLGDTGASLATGILIEDCDAVVLEGCSTGGIAGTGLKIVANAGGHAPTNHFFLNSVFDATDTGHCAWVTGGQGVYRTKFNGCWFASAGAMAGTSNGNGLRIDVPASGEITGCNFYVSRGTGLYIDATSAALAVTGNTFEGNGVGGGVNNNDGIYLNLPVNNLGPVLTGNQDLGSNGVSIRTGATTNRIMVVGNRWVSGTAYGTPPVVDANNGA